MKTHFSILTACLVMGQAFGQASGNANYRGEASGHINYQTGSRLPESTIHVAPPADNDLVITVKGMANIKADAYVAIFGVSQTGKTAEETNALMDTRINQLLEQFKNKPGITTYVDMVSFVPMYEYELEKKVFSKQTYNEVPAGFELKKNIHVKFGNADDLHQIVMLMSKSEVYDLVRVDYFSEHLETVKKELMAKAKTAVLEKLKTYQSLLGNKPDSTERRLSDGYRVMLPIEMYKTCQAFNSSSLNAKKSAGVNPADKGTTLYYQPVLDKEFDFVINPIVMEPVIQVLYELQLHIATDKAVSPSSKQFMLITPGGDLKSLSLN